MRDVLLVLDRRRGGGDAVGSGLVGVEGRPNKFVGGLTVKTMLNAGQYRVETSFGTSLPERRLSLIFVSGRSGADYPG